MTVFTKYVLPAILIFLGGLIGAYLTSKFNYNDWTQRTHYEQQVKLFEQRLQLIERTTAIISKMPSTNDLFDIYFSDITNTSKQNKLNKEQLISLTEKLGNIRAELRSVMFLNQIYFGDSTKAKIQKYLITDKKSTWWDLPDSTYNEIVETMGKELNTSANTYISTGDKVIQPMTDVSKIFWTAFATIIGGILIYVIGRIIERFVLEPLQEYKKTLANILDTLIFYAKTYSNTNVSTEEDKKEASRAIRKLASDLSAKTHQINLHWFFTKTGIIPSRKNSMDASLTLISLSNSLWHTNFINEIEQRRQEIETLLKIKT